MDNIAENQTDHCPHPVLCAWCEDEGTRTVLAFSEVSHSHGICPRHAALLRRQAEAAREKIHATGG